jgi:hypothetical protein
MRLIEELIQRDVIARPGADALLKAAINDLETCPEFGTRVEDAIKMIRKELTLGGVAADTAQSLG